MEWHEDVLDFWFLSDGDGAEQKKTVWDKKRGCAKTKQSIKRETWTNSNSANIKESLKRNRL